MSLHAINQTIRGFRQRLLAHQAISQYNAALCNIPYAERGSRMPEPPIAYLED